MKQLIIAACLFPLYIQAQSGNTHIKATITGMETGKKIYLKDSRYKEIDSATSVANGFAFNFHIPEGEGSSYVLQIGNLNGLDNTTLPLYIDKGTILIKGNGPLFKDVQLSGPAFIKDYNDFHQFIKPSVIAFGEVNRKMSAARKINDTIAIRQSGIQLHETDSINRQLTRQWIEAHRSSPISVWVLSTRYFYSTLEKYESLFRKLQPAAINNALGKKMKEQVLINDLNGIGKTAPGFTLTDTAGKQVSLNDFKGKYVLLDFWASWCVPCRKETPYLREALQQYSVKDFTIVSVSIDTDTLKWIQAVRKDEMQWTNLIDPAINRSWAIRGYYVPTVPTNLLIDPNGKILARNLRGGELGKKLEKVLGRKENAGVNN